jgi:NADH:ubiquinone oxidoreductase subunit 5 (subunit L)/multisubunit Na+/H+ antiporter MnhA subunit
MKLTVSLLALIGPGCLLAGVLLELILAKILAPRAKGVLAVLCCVPSLATVLILLSKLRDGNFLDLRLGTWDGPLSLSLRIDALSLLFAFMATAIGAIVLLYSIGYMAEDHATTRFYAIILTFIGGLVGLVYFSNLFLMYVCWEVVGLCSFGLVGFWYTNPEAVQGARKVLLMTHLAGYGLLAAILILYARTGSALWTDSAVSHAFTGGIFLLMLLALVAKSVQFPLHTWIPEAMAAPTPVSALLHAACYVKAGVYLAARMHSFAAWPISWGTTMVWVGCVTMIVGVMYAMVQGDLKRMLAFHTVSQIGYMITGLGIGTPLAITAGLLHCLNHGFFKGGLFLSAGSVQRATGTRDMNELGGIAQCMPRTTAAWLVGAASIMGIPLTSGFVGKWMLYTASLQAGLVIPALCAWVASLGTVFSFAKATSSVFLGETTPKSEHAHEAPPSMLWGLGLISAGSIVLGIAPQFAVNYLLNPVLAALGFATAVQVSWFGLLTSAGSWWTTGGLVLAIVSVVVGTLVYAMGKPTRLLAVSGAAVATVGSGVFTGGEDLPGEGRLPARDFSQILKSHWGPFFHVVDVDRYYLSLWNGISAVARWFAQLTAWAEGQAIVWTVALGLAVVCALRWLMAPIANTNVAVALGIPHLLLIGCSTACVALCLSAAANVKWRSQTLLLLFSGALAIAGLATHREPFGLALLELATLVGLLLVWRYASSSEAKWVYLAMLLFSAATIVSGDHLLLKGDTEWARALLISGFFLKLAIIPLSLWLLQLADELPALILGLIISVLDIAAFGELYLIAQAAPSVFSPRPVWMAAALVCSLGGAVLMLAQKNLKRLLVLSTIEDLGFLLLGVASLSEVGFEGAVIGAAVHAVAKALLFVTLASAEADGNLKPESAGLASLYPLSGAGFLFGMLTVLGVPPTVGFLSRWRLYSVDLHAGPWFLFGFILASGIALIAYAFALTRFWWGPKPANNEIAKEPALLRIVIILLIILLLMGGLWPHPLLIVTGGMP